MQDRHLGKKIRPKRRPKSREETPKKGTRPKAQWITYAALRNMQASHEAVDVELAGVAVRSHAFST